MDGLRRISLLLCLSLAPGLSTAQNAPPATAAQTLKPGDAPGQSVCRDSADAALRYHGRLLGFERGKAQIQIGSAIRKNDGQPLAGFHSTAVWDEPGNWTYCE
ncbi:hypothetical protein SAMN04488038_110163 [Solimonas aquatica]|uniref:Uncharacterized protein n=1 Tax=Solimonas aquatica TaxID=489703 RepID=A0A1H9ISQ4_9GAMM|nr:hypothetical protein [Solimonas aquatica]SEQ77623.1 hypothetical protein SAMN04488038_110163 [Solimonas aquatica]